MDATGENLLTDIKLGRVLGMLARQVGASVRTTPDYIEFFDPKGDEDVRTARRAEERKELRRMEEEQVKAFNAARRDWFGWLGPWTDETVEPDEPARPRVVRAKPRPETLAWLDRGIQAVPNAAQLYYARAMIQLERGEFEAAIADLNQAIKLKPGYPEAVRMRTIADSAKDKQVRERDEFAARPHEKRDLFLALMADTFGASDIAPERMTELKTKVVEVDAK
jgi:hypothetical protein